MFGNMDQKDISDRYCPKLFTFLEVAEGGDCYLCCPAWLPIKIGNLMNDDFDSIWNSKAAQEARAQVYSGNWNRCVHTLCPAIQSNNLPKLDGIVADGRFGFTDTHVDIVKAENTVVDELPTIIHLSEDRSCNLFCPSCRVSKIMFAPGNNQYEIARQINEKVYDLFFSKPTDRVFQLNMTGSGDPFASKIYRDFLRKLDGRMYPNLTVNLLTNGVMFTPKIWSQIQHIHKQLSDCRISIDAGTKDTYENKTRLGGDWDLLMENCKFLDQQVPSLPKLKINFDFVVQACNFEEMVQYADMCLTEFPNATSVHFNKLSNWGTWSTEEFLNRAVWMADHPKHEEFLRVLEHPVFNNPKVYLGNMSSYRKKIDN